MKNLRTEIHGLVGRLTKKANNIQAKRNMSNASSTKKAKMSYQKKRSSTMQEKLRSIYFIDPTDGKVYKTKQKTHEKVGNSDGSSHALQDQRRSATEKLVALLTFARQNTHASWKPTSIRECVWKELHMKIMKTILQGKGNPFTELLQSCAQVSPYASFNEISGSKSSSGKKWETSRKYQRGS